MILFGATLDHVSKDVILPGERYLWGIGETDA